MKGNLCLLLLVSQTLVRYGWIRLDEDPALQRLDDEIHARRKGFVSVGFAGLGAALVEVTIQPETEFAVSRAYAEALVVAFDKI